MYFGWDFDLSTSPGYQLEKSNLRTQVRYFVDDTVQAVKSGLTSQVSTH
jgi:hypothetical protein